MVPERKSMLLCPLFGFRSPVIVAVVVKKLFVQENIDPLLVCGGLGGCSPPSQIAGWVRSVQNASRRISKMVFAIFLPAGSFLQGRMGVPTRWPAGSFVVY